MVAKKQKNFKKSYCLQCVHGNVLERPFWVKGAVLLCRFSPVGLAHISPTRKRLFDKTEREVGQHATSTATHTDDTDSYLTH